MRILPTAMPIAMMKEFSIIVPTGSRVERDVPMNDGAGSSSRRAWSPGMSGMLPLVIVAASQVEATNAR